MSKKLPSGITRTFLEQVPLPNHGGRYAPIAHKSIIDNSLTEIVSRNLNVETELYSSTHNGNVANGKIILSNGADSELQMMFIWGNSYDKSTRFKCGIGAYIKHTGAYLFAGDLSSFSRKHTGTANQEAMEMIQTQLSQANAYYNVLCKSKDEMKTRSLTMRQMSEILGVLFVEKEYLNKEQMTVIADRIRNEVKMFENLPFNNMWNFYNIIAYAMKDGHPKFWFENQSGVHKFFITELMNSPITNVAAINPVIESNLNQLNLLDQIEEAESNQKTDTISLNVFDDVSLDLPEL